MSLKKYTKKLDFKKTTEPAGKIKKTGKYRFVVQEHYARNLHYDFRLEMDGVLKSWAVPKGVPTKPKVKRLAVEVEDHPVDYIFFKGKIPKGEYGAGVVKIWDKGDYRLVEINQPTPKGIKSMKIELRGKKLKGDYALVKLSGKNWLVFKVE